MERLILKPEYLDKIKNDQILFGKVALALGIGAGSLPRALKSTNKRLTEATVLKVLREHLKVSKDSELLMPDLQAA